MRPAPGETLADPASGAGGFPLAAHDYVARRHGALDKHQWRHLRQEALNGWEIVDNTARLRVMNLYLHGAGSTTCAPTRSSRSSRTRFWLRDEGLEDSANLPEPDVLAAEIVQDLQAALEQFAAIAEDLEVER